MQTKRMEGKTNLCKIPFFTSKRGGTCFIIIELTVNLSAIMNTIMEAMKQIQTHTSSTICKLSGVVPNSPQVGLQSSVLFSSKKKPSAHSSMSSPELWLPMI